MFIWGNILYEERSFCKEVPVQLRFTRHPAVYTGSDQHAHDQRDFWEAAKLLHHAIQDNALVRLVFCFGRCLQLQLRLDSSHKPPSASQFLQSISLISACLSLRKSMEVTERDLQSSRPNQGSTFSGHCTTLNQPWPWKPPLSSKAAYFSASHNVL